MPIVRKESKADPRLRWFDDARFGMFVHFGVYAPLGKGEWAMYSEDIRREEYVRLAQSFNPDRFDADQWVDIAERAGARYITLTSKHHDGFCLFDSALTDWKITNTPFRRDLVGELVAACQARDMRIILYYSQPDWHHPNFVHLPGAFKDLWYRRGDDEPDWPKYQAYVEGQVLELVTKYGRIDGIWWDGSHKSEQAWRGRHLYELIKQHQPHAVVNDRARWGDFFTPERSLPEDLTGYLFEACESVTAQSWGWKSETPLFSVPHLVDSLLRMASAGGNYSLNVSPKPDGSIPEMQVARMAAIGDWLRANGEAIYGTQAGKLCGLSEDLRATRKGNDLYVFLRQWPISDRLRLSGVRSQPEEAVLLCNGAKLDATLGAEELTLSGLPMTAPDANPQVIRLRFAAEPALAEVQPRVREPNLIRVVAAGGTRLPVADAAFQGFAVKGSRLRVEDGATRNWMTLDQRAIWDVECLSAGDYLLRLELRCAKLYAGSTFAVRVGDQVVSGVVEGRDLPGQEGVPSNAPGGTFVWQDVGVVRLDAGRARLVLAPTYMPYGYLFADVRALELAPVARAQA